MELELKQEKSMSARTNEDINSEVLAAVTRAIRDRNFDENFP